MMLAFFMNTAIDQQVEKHLRATGEWESAKQRRRSTTYFEGRPNGRVTLVICLDGNDGLGLGLLGVSGDKVVDAETYARIKQGDPGDGARHGSGRHPEGGPGAEHLHLLDRIRDEDDG